MPILPSQRQTMTHADARQFAPATQRNREPILTVLQQVLPPQGLVLEIASGAGEHAVYFAPRLAPRHWLPTDAAPEAIASIQAWQAHCPTPTLQPPLALDVSQADWPQVFQAARCQAAWQALPLTAIVTINMIHISPWSATVGLMAGAQALLPVGGILYLYGPYFQEGVPTAPSNEAFDQSLRSRHPEWGVRHLEAVVALAANYHLHWQQTVEMPANNVSIVLERREA